MKNTSDCGIVTVITISLIFHKTVRVKMLFFTSITISDFVHEFIAIQSPFYALLLFNCSLNIFVIEITHKLFPGSKFDELLLTRYITSEFLFPSHVFVLYKKHQCDLCSNLPKLFCSITWSIFFISITFSLLEFFLAFFKPFNVLPFVRTTFCKIIVSKFTCKYGSKLQQKYQVSWTVLL